MSANVIDILTASVTSPWLKIRAPLGELNWERENKRWERERDTDEEGGGERWARERESVMNLRPCVEERWWRRSWKAVDEQNPSKVNWSELNGWNVEKSKFPTQGLNAAY